MKTGYVLHLLIILLVLSGCGTSMLKKQYKIDWHSIDIQGVDGGTQNVQMSISSDRYSASGLVEFDSLSRESNIYTSGLLLDGPTPDWFEIEMIVDGTNYTGRYEIPDDAKNRVAISGIHFTLTPTGLTGQHTYRTFSNRRSARDWRNVTEWRFHGNGSIRSVDKLYKCANGDRVRITWEFIAGSPDLREVMIGKGDDSNGAEYFHFQDNTLQSNEWFTGFSADIPKMYHFNADGKLARITTISDRSKWDVEIPVDPNATIPVPSDVSTVLPKDIDWVNELIDAGLVP